MNATIYSVIAVLAIGWALIDLTRREVRHVPKWMWALVIAFFIFPIGALLYFVLECTPIGDPEERGSGGAGS
jgi:drug/metabolite transporter (DMT)-like permease